MKKIWLSLLILSGSLFASNYSFYADYLYWNVTEFDLSSSRTVSPITTTEFLCPEYQSGWRVGGLYQCSCWDLAARYTSYENRTTRTITNPPFPNSGTNVFEFDLSVFDFEFGIPMTIACECFSLRPLIGAKFLWIDDHFDEIANQNDSRTHIKGYGLYAGVEGRYTLMDNGSFCRGLSLALVARGDYGVLYSETTHTSVNSTSTIPTTTNSQTQCLYVSVVELFAGLDVGYTCFACYHPHVMIGYETTTLVSMPSSATTLSNGTIGYGGLVTRFQLDF